MTATTLGDASAQFVDTGCEQFFLRRVGRGTPLLFVHGFPLSGLTWRHLIDAFVDDFDCIVPDVPGLGATRWSEASDFSFPGQGAALQRLTDALSLDDYVVLAQDTGGTFARYLALDDPRVRALVLINTEIPHHRPPWIPTYQRLMRLPMSERGLGLLARSRRYVHSSAAFGGCFHNRALLDGEFHELFIAPLRTSHRVQLGVRRYLRGATWGPVDRLATRHEELAIPVRLVWGVCDPTFPLSEARGMLKQFPNVDLVEVENACLLPHEEQPDAVVAATYGWLKQHLRR